MTFFPWMQPASGTARANKSNGFQETIVDQEYLEMVRRNQAGHAIVVDVASDAFTGFTCDPIDRDVQAMYQDMIAGPLTEAYTYCRMYGYCGLLVGYAGEPDMSLKPDPSSMIEYLQPVPKPWVEEIVYEKQGGHPSLPLTVESYKINTSSGPQTIDEGRMILLSNPTLDPGSVEGEPSLRCVFDLLSVLKSMDWGVGQAMWRHGGGLTAFVVPESRNQQEQINAIDELVTDINSMTTLTLPAGTQMLSERPGSLDPSPYYQAVIQQISLGTRIPVSVLIGAQAGTLSASMKDRHDYYELLGDIHDDVLTGALTDVLTRLQVSGQLPDGEFVVEWEDMPEWVEAETNGTTQAEPTGRDGKEYT